jgi:hypothetical protein
MANEQMVKSLELKRALNVLDESAIEIYETREALGLVVQALEDIINTPNKMASDSRAIKEMVRIATEAINQVVEE